MAYTASKNCSWNPLDGNSCVSQVVGGVGNAVTNPGRTWADTGGGLVNNVHDAVGAGAQWVKEHPEEAISLFAATTAFVAVCVFACAELVAGAAIMADVSASGAGLGTAAFLGCAQACSALITVGPVGIGAVSAWLTAVTGDSRYDVGEVPELGPEFPASHVRDPLAAPGPQIHWEP